MSHDSVELLHGQGHGCHGLTGMGTPRYNRDKLLHACRQWKFSGIASEAAVVESTRQLICLKIWTLNTEVTREYFKTSLP